MAILRQVNGDVSPLFDLLDCQGETRLRKYFGWDESLYQESWEKFELFLKEVKWTKQLSPNDEGYDRFFSSVLGSETYT